MNFVNKYFLKADVTVDEVYECITTFMDPCSTCGQKNVAHKKLEIADDNGFARWVKHEKENVYNLMEFTCYESNKDGELDLKIWFDLNVTDGEKGKVHLLVVECKEKNTEERVFKFFNKLEKLVPRAYKQNDLKKAYVEMRRSEKNSEIGNFYVEFKEDKEGKYFFGKEKMALLLKDLWFLGVDFQGSTYEDYIKRYMDKTSGELRIVNSGYYSSKFSKEFFKSFEKKMVENDAEKSFNPDSQIIIQERKHDICIILKKDDCGNSYEELRDKIISSVENIKEQIKAKDGELKNVFWEDLEILKQENPEKEDDAQLMLEIQKEANQALKDEIQKLTELYNKSQKENECLKEENKNLSEELMEERFEKNELIKKLDSLSANKNDNQLFDYLDLEENYNKALKTVDYLQKSLSEIEAKKLEEQNGNNNGYISLKIPCTLKNLYADEIEDFLYKVLYDALDLKYRLLPENEKVEVTRLRDVLENIFDCKIFNDAKCNTKALFNRVFNAVKDVKRIDFAGLKADGFVFNRPINNHIVSFFRDERYEVVFPSTAQDTSHGGKNLFNDVTNRIFMI